VRLLRFGAHPLTHSPTHPLTHSPTHPLTHSPTHPLTHSPTHPLTHSTCDPVTQSTCPWYHVTLSLSLILSPSHPPVHSLADFLFMRPTVLAEASRQVADPHDPSVQAGSLRQSCAVRRWQCASKTGNASATASETKPCLAPRRLHASARSRCCGHSPHLTNQPCSSPMQPPLSRLFRRATYTGEDFGKVVTEFVKAPINTGRRSVRQQRESVYHMYAQRRIRGDPETREKDVDKGEVGGHNKQRREHALPPP
jgi:hypothetical protein